MEYATTKIEAGRDIVREQKQRVVPQHKKFEQAPADRDPADELQARLLIMEQSLICMTRFLRTLEKDLESALGIHKPRTRKRRKAKKQEEARPETIEATADRLASRATAAIPVADDRLQPFDTLARAMQKLAGH